MLAKLYGTRDQWRVVECPAKYIGYFAGRRYGKTTTARLRILARCLKNPGFQYWYITPEYSQCIEEYESLISDPEFSKIIARYKRDPFPQTWFKNGSRVGYRTFANPKSCRSRGLNEVWCDEIQDFAERDFNTVVRPLIADRRGTLIVSGQFRGHNWYHDEFYLKGQDRANSLYASFRFPTSSGLMFQSPQGIAQLENDRLSLPRAVWEQEYECIPAANQAAVFRYDDIARCIRGCVSPNPRPNQVYVAGLDIGRVVDQSAIVVLEAGTGVVVHAEKFSLGMHHAQQAMAAAAIKRRYNATLVVDSTGGGGGGHVEKDSIVSEYRKVIPDLREFVWTLANKERLIGQLSLEIEQAKLSIPAVCEDVIGELKAYEYARSRTLRYTYGAPSGLHDDYIAALAMAVWARHAKWFPYQNGSSLAVLR